MLFLLLYSLFSELRMTHFFRCQRCLSLPCTNVEIYALETSSHANHLAIHNEWREAIQTSFCMLVHRNKDLACHEIKVKLSSGLRYHNFKLQSDKIENDHKANNSLPDTHAPKSKHRESFLLVFLPGYVDRRNRLFERKLFVLFAEK